ncbi:MAG: UPF0280 family protein [Desulfonatronovibrionaceae bacterium]
MKHTSSERKYRTICSPRSGETAYQAVVEESDLYIISRGNHARAVLKRLTTIRGWIKAYILAHPGFAESLEPVEYREPCPALIKEMILAGQMFNVGPMAAVAGAIAQDTARHISRVSSEALVENGGDIYIFSTRDRQVALLPCPEKGASLGIKVKASDTPCSICSSSSTIGHSLSLGRGSLVSVRAESGAVADAAATALCNMIKSRKSLHKLENKRSELEKKGIQGVFAQAGNDMLVWGNMELVMI